MKNPPLETEPSASAAATTPMLKQYHAVKARHPDCILLFRLGDFYEMFFQDAVIASKILDVVLTARGKGSAAEVPMCGFPYHAADAYIARLIKAGYKTAICEQLENPAEAKGVVRRDVTRVITAGTFLDENSTEARFLTCLYHDKNAFALAFMDPAEGTIRTHRLSDNISTLRNFLSQRHVHECLFPEKQNEQFEKILKPLLAAYGLQLTAVEDWHFNPDICRKHLCDHFGVANLHGFDLDNDPTLASCASALLDYVKRMNQQQLRHVDRIQRWTDDAYVVISAAAMRGLEMDNVIRSLDRTLTPMGRRLFRFWLTHPLKNTEAIRERQNAVEVLKDSPQACAGLKNVLAQMPDIDKHLSRISSGYTHPKDLLALRNALSLIPELTNILHQLEKGRHGSLPLLKILDIPDLREYLNRVINPDCPLSKPEGKVICEGFDAELDRLRGLHSDGQTWLKTHQEEEIRRTGISSLKISFNRVFGYYIEITRANLHLVPSDYIRKQTLVNAERFVTPKLNEYEQTILTAEEKILDLEQKIIRDVQQKILAASQEIHAFSRRVAEIDSLFSFALTAQDAHYTRPSVNNEAVIDIRQGRHPVLALTLKDDFIPNDTLLNNSDQRLIILTGPNMAGKSTWIRQTALLVILAQSGSFIPAETATIGTVDKIFTRIGAHDDISRGQSTFMVEMNETADILNNLSERSLVILDEIGRGTSTYDGLSLAWALVEHLHTTQARVLFATHFHELISLAETHSGIKNYNVAVKEWNDSIIFLHKIIPGGADDSYGIYVAKLAGIPSHVTQRAREILTHLESKDNVNAIQENPVGAMASRGKTTHELPLQMHFGFSKSSTDEQKHLNKLRQQLDKVDLNNTTPMEALKILEKLKKSP